MLHHASCVFYDSVKGALDFNATCELLEVVAAEA